MSITSRISSMEEHVTNAYDELQGLGADLTNVNKNIENISMVLDNIYDSMPQVSGEGTSLTLDDTRVGKIKSTLKGNTEQTGTPTPSSPIPVNVVSGDNEINVTGRNLLEGVEYGDIIAQTGEETTSTSVIKSKNYIPYYRNTTYYLSVNSVMPTNMGINLRFYNKNKEYIGYAGLTGSGSNFNITIVTSVGDTTPMYFRFRETLSVGPITSLNDNVMITTVNDMNYEPFGNTYNIDLPEGMELCKIGNYQDYFYKDSGKWYLHKEIGKVVLDENSNISTHLYGTNSFQTYTNNILKNDNLLCVISDYFKGVSYDNRTSGDNLIYSVSNDPTFDLVIRNTTFTSLADFKTWLSTHNVVVYYVLATPVNTALEDM